MKNILLALLILFSILSFGQDKKTKLEKITIITYRVQNDIDSEKLTDVIIDSYKTKLDSNFRDIDSLIRNNYIVSINNLINNKVCTDKYNNFRYMEYLIAKQSLELFGLFNKKSDTIYHKYVQVPLVPFIDSIAYYQTIPFDFQDTIKYKKRGIIKLNDTLNIRIYGYVFINKYNSRIFNDSLIIEMNNLDFIVTDVSIINNSKNLREKYVNEILHNSAEFIHKPEDIKYIQKSGFDIEYCSSNKKQIKSYVYSLIIETIKKNSKYKVRITEV